MKIALVASMLALAGAFPSSGFAQTLTPVESSMVKAVDTETSTAVALLEQIVDINSGTMNLVGVVAVKDVVLPQIEALGFKVKWVPIEAFDKRAGDLVAEHPCPATIALTL